MASATVNVRVVREGLLVKLYTVESNRLIAELDLSKELNLSDEQAALLLAGLEESKKG